MGRGCDRISGFIRRHRRALSACTKKGPHEDAARWPPASWEERSRQKPTLLAPRPWMSGLQNSEKINLSAQSWYSAVVAQRDQDNRGTKPPASLHGVCCQMSQIWPWEAWGIRVQNVRKAQARCGFRLWPSRPGLPRGQSQEISAPGTGPAPGQALLALPPRTVGTGGLVWVPSPQSGVGLQPDSPLIPQPLPQSAAPPQEPHESGIWPHFLWPHQIFELTFTSSWQARTAFE